jgi:hypothetical protein
MAEYLCRGTTEHHAVQRRHLSDQRARRPRLVAVTASELHRNGDNNGAHSSIARKPATHLIVSSGGRILLRASGWICSSSSSSSSTSSSRKPRWRNTRGSVCGPLGH